MLIININYDSSAKNKNTRKIFSRFYKHNEINSKNTKPFRDTIKIDNKVFSVLNIREGDLENDNVIMLLKVFKGKVLKTDNDCINKKIKEYLINIRPYEKRAFLSAILNILKNNIDYKFSILIKDSNLEVTDELKNIAKFSRKLGFLCREDSNYVAFKDYCFREFGLNINNEKTLDNYDICIDLDKVGNENKIEILYKNKVAILNYDSSYFLINDKVRKLLDYRVDLKTACACVSGTEFT